MTIIFVA